MTDRLYYTDPYLRAFDATIVRVDRRGDRLLVGLDRTAFYPTSGGQPFDTGTLGAMRVTDVVDEDDGSVTHVTELKTENLEVKTGDGVSCEIDRGCVRAQVESHRAYPEQPIEGRRKHVLPRVLLHVIEPPRPVDRAAHVRPAVEGSLHDVTDLAILTIDHINDARAAERSRVERLPA